MQARYLVVIEKGLKNYSAFSPDVPGCIATGRSIESTIDEMRSAIEFHLEGLVEKGDDLPATQGLEFYLNGENEFSGEDILAHIVVDTPEMALA